MNRANLVWSLGEMSDKQPKEDGENILANYLTWWFENRCSFPDTEDIRECLPLLLDEAMRDLKFSTDEKVLLFKRVFLAEMRWTYFSEISKVAFSDSTREDMILYIIDIIEESTHNETLARRVEGYFYAQDNVLNQYLSMFITTVWQKGLFQILQQWQVPMRARFGRTTLRITQKFEAFALTFERELASDSYDDGTAVLYMKNTDPTGYLSEVGAVETLFSNACDMIQEVIENWPDISEEQRAAFTVLR
jgi:hypothetical protein